MRLQLRRGALALALAYALTVPAACADDAQTAEDAFEQYQEQLEELISSQDRTFFFDTMQLTIGSDVLLLDGEAQQMDTSPALQNGRTMLPIRAIAEAVGAVVEYEPETKAVTITSRYGDIIQCPVGSDEMTINGTACALDSPAYIQNGRTYLPVRAVAEALELAVEWDGATGTVTITAPYQTCRLLVVAETLDADALGAETVLTDGVTLWVLQFASPAAARAAAEQLRAQGILAEPDNSILLTSEDEE